MGTIIFEPLHWLKVKCKRGDFIPQCDLNSKKTQKFGEMKIFRVFLVSTGVVCGLSLVGAAPTLDGLLGGADGGPLAGLLGGGDGGPLAGLLGGLPDKSNIFGGLLGGNSRSDDDGDPFQAIIAFLPNLFGEIIAAKVQLLGKLLGGALGGDSLENNLGILGGSEGPRGLLGGPLLSLLGGSLGLGGGRQGRDFARVVDEVESQDVKR